MTATTAASAYAIEDGFTGRLLDSESGLWYFRNRYFDSSLGRFTQRDPMGYVDGMNLSSGYFVLNGVDPFGLCTDCLTCFYREKDGKIELAIEAPRSREAQLKSTGMQIDSTGEKCKTFFAAQKKAFDEAAAAQAALLAKRNAENAGKDPEEGSIIKKIQDPGPGLNGPAATDPVVQGLVKDFLEENMSSAMRAAVSGNPVDALSAMWETLDPAQKLKIIANLARAGWTICNKTGKVIKVAVNEAKGAQKVTGDALKKMRDEFDKLRPQAWKDEAAKNPGKYTKEQLDEMKEGRAPKGSDGEPMEVHHKTPLSEGGQNAFDNYQFMTRTEHRIGENFRKNHPK